MCTTNQSFLNVNPVFSCDTLRCYTVHGILRNVKRQYTTMFGLGYSYFGQIFHKKLNQCSISGNTLFPTVFSSLNLIDMDMCEHWTVSIKSKPTCHLILARRRSSRAYSTEQMRRTQPAAAAARGLYAGSSAACVNTTSAVIYQQSIQRQPFNLW